MDRVALIVPYGELAILPGVVNSAQLLAEHGYGVDVIVAASERFQGIPAHDFNNPAVRITPYHPGPLARLKGLGWLIGVPGLSATVRRVCRDGGYRCFFGVDAEGLIAATWAGRHLGVPVVYYSLEMELARGETRLFFSALRSRHSPFRVLLRRFLKNRLTAWFKKPLERWAHRRAVLTLAPDEVRARVLLADNQLPQAEVLIVPPSPLALRRAPDRSYLRRRFGLDSSRTVLLQIGGISDVARSLELAQASLSWPDEWTLILHGFATDPGYLSRVGELADGRRLIVSTSMVPYAELDDLVASADIGLALYRGIDLNYVHMASGKLFHYLKCGLPIIATDFPNLRQILQDGSCGLCVRDEADIAPAAQRILADRAVWAMNAQRCFREEYDFALHFAHVLKRISQL